jgi:hypothetical protein
MIEIMEKGYGLLDKDKSKVLEDIKEQETLTENIFPKTHEVLSTKKSKVLEALNKRGVLKLDLFLKP